MDSLAQFLDRTFHLHERETTIGSELLGGITTFMALSYAISVQPATLTKAGTEGIALGFISHSMLKLATGRARDVLWGFHGVALALLLRYIFLVDS